MRGVDSEISGRTEDIHGNHTGYFYIDPELSLRDLFAAFALAGIASANLDQDYKVDANMAYLYADAMLEARETSEASKEVGTSG